MATPSQKELDQDIFRAIECLERSGIKAFGSSTIASFLTGKKSSPHYGIFKKYPKLCGVYTSIGAEEIELSLARLCRSKAIKATVLASGKKRYSVEKKARTSGGKDAKKPSSPTNPPKDPVPTSFYESALPPERKVLDEFKKLVHGLLPDHKLEDKPYIYAFVPKVVTDPENKNRVWISRDRKTRKLKLHYKRKAGGPESEPLDLTTAKKINEAWRVLRVAYGTKTVSEVEKIVGRIRSKDPFDEYQSENVRGIELMPHQKAGVELSNRYDRFAFFYDTGTGKTIMTLEIMMQKQAKSGGRFLIIAPKALIKSAWMDDSRYFPKMRLLPLSKNMTLTDYARLYDEWEVLDGRPRRYTDDDGMPFGRIGKALGESILAELKARAKHFIVNIDAIREPAKGRKLLKEIKVNGLVIDESAVIKNYRTGNAVRMRVFAKKMKYVYLLSGKPAPNNTIEYYSQMVIVDPQTFAITFDSFVTKYYKEIRPGRFVDKNDRTRAEVARMVGNRSIIVKKEECIRLPRYVHSKRSVELDDRTRRFYKEVMERFVAEIIDMNGKRLRVYSMAKLASIMKLREIASGFYLDEDDVYQLNPHKADALVDLVKEIGTDESGRPNQVLIWCTFKHEIETLEERLIDEGYRVVNAYSRSGKALDDNIKAFKNGEADIMIAHPKTLKYGVTFTKCHYCIFSSLSYSYEDYYQAHDRIYRKGQENVCFFYHLLSEETIDEIIYRCITEKASKSKLFERLIKSFSAYGLSRDQIEEALKVKPAIKAVATADSELS